MCPPEVKQDQESDIGRFLRFYLSSHVRDQEYVLAATLYPIQGIISYHIKQDQEAFEISVDYSFTSVS